MFSHLQIIGRMDMIPAHQVLNTDASLLRQSRKGISGVDNQRVIGRLAISGVFQMMTPINHQLLAHLQVTRGAQMIPLLHLLNTDPGPHGYL